MSESVMAEILAKLTNLEAGQATLRTDFLAALGQRTAEIMAKLATIQSDAAAAMATSLDANRKLRSGRNDLSGLDERLDAESRRITTLADRLAALEDRAGKAPPLAPRHPKWRRGHE